MDIVPSHVRSRMMASIRSKNSRPELVIRRYLHANGFRFRLHKRDLPGRPDLVLPRWKVVVFVHGCFWHGHAGCRYFRWPATRVDFWKKKISLNVERDRRAEDSLRTLGWRLAIVWECALREKPDSALGDLSRWIRSSSKELEIFSEAAQVCPRAE